MSLLIASALTLALVAATVGHIRSAWLALGAWREAGKGPEPRAFEPSRRSGGKRLKEKEIFES